jgi:membrane-associated phospholipid phosphatase
VKDFLRRHEQPLVAVAMLVVWALGYVVSGRLVEHGETHSLAVRLDSEIPFSPPFVWIYLTVYMAFIIPFLLIQDKRFFRLCVASYLSVILVSVAWFMLYPVRHDRPSFAVDSLSTWALSLMYAIDTPVNCFPSMHASMAMMAALIILEVSAPLGYLALVHTLFIGASTLFIKQHFVLDIVAGFSLAVLMYYLFFRQRVIDVLSKNLVSLEASIGGAINERIDARVRHVLDEILDEMIEHKLNEHLEGDPPQRRRTKS